MAHKKTSGTKPLILGVVVTLLALLNIFFSVASDSRIDPFYLFLAAIGASLTVYGTWMKIMRREKQEALDCNR
jgi:hypothetical protein